MSVDWYVMNQLTGKCVVGMQVVLACLVMTIIFTWGTIRMIRDKEIPCAIILFLCAMFFAFWFGMEFESYIRYSFGKWAVMV